MLQLVAYDHPCASELLSVSSRHLSSSQTQPEGSQTPASDGYLRCILSSENGPWKSVGKRPAREKGEKGVRRRWFSHTSSRTTPGSSPQKPCFEPYSRISTGEKE